MTIDRALLARYLRQRLELGERELYLDSTTADQVRRFIAGEAIPEWAAERGNGKLQLLHEEICACGRCALGGTRANAVPGEGSATADVVVVGEAPGAEEDRTGRPFVGRAGKLLDLMLMSIGLPREQVFICNVLKCRPPENRDPLPAEIEACTAFLHRQIEAMAPKALLAVGKFAAQFLGESDAPISKLRGRVHRYRGTPVIATYHPAFLLRSPTAIRSAWQDLQLLRQVLDEQV